MYGSNFRRRASRSARARIGGDPWRAGVKMRVRKALGVSAALVVLAACGGSSFLEHVLTISISATTTNAAVGEEVDFTFAATGPFVIGIIVAFGDGVADSLEITQGVTSASGGFTHAFDTVGAFLVEGTVVDAREGRLTDTLFIDITP